MCKKSGTSWPHKTVSFDAGRVKHEVFTTNPARKHRRLCEEGLSLRDPRRARLLPNLKDLCSQSPKADNSAVTAGGQDATRMSRMK